MNFKIILDSKYLIKDHGKVLLLKSYFSDFLSKWCITFLNLNIFNYWISNIGFYTIIKTDLKLDLYENMKNSYKIRLKNDYLEGGKHLTKQNKNQPLLLLLQLF